MPSENKENIIAEIDWLMKQFSHTKKDIGYGRRRTFHNGMWFDLIDYKKKDMQILRVGRGAWLVHQYPLLHGLFDHVSKVIAKLEIKSTQTLHDKHLVGIFEILHNAEKNIGVFDHLKD